MAAENAEANQPARAQESRPEPLMSRPDIQALYESPRPSSGSDRNGGDGKGGNPNGNDSTSQTLKFNTGDLYKQTSSMMQQFSTADGQSPAIADSLPDNSKLPENDLKDRMSTGTTHVRKGEDIEGVAQRKLGENSTPEERQAFIKALQAINGLEPGAELKKGQRLQLPGVNDHGDFVHSEDGVERTWSTTDGSTTTRTLDGTTTINEADGTTVIEQPNGDRITTKGDTTTLNRADGTTIISSPRGETTYTKENLTIERGPDGRLQRVGGPPPHNGYEKTSDGQGGTVERGAGARPDQNYSLVQSRDGRIEVFDRSEGRDRVSRFMDNPAVEAERRGTMERAERLFKDPAELAKFKADMIRFEARAQERGMDPAKVAETYRATNRMLDGGANSKIPQDGRNLLAQQLMSHAATPTSIDQGNHNTCSVASLEANVFAKEPDKAANLLADVALTGRFKSPVDGKSLTVPPGSLKPDHEAANRTPIDGQRDFASQIFQVTAINLLYQQQHTLPWTYEQEHVPAGDRRTGDKGERDRLFGIWTGKEFGGLTDSQEKIIHERITGKKDPDLHLQRFNSPQELGRELERLQREGKLPAQVGIHTANPPLNRVPGGWHAVGVTGYDPTTQTVKLDNQWGSNQDHLTQGIKLEQFHQMQMNPETARQLRRVAAHEKAFSENPTASQPMRELRALEIVSNGGDRISAEELERATKNAINDLKLGDAPGRFGSGEKDKGQQTIQNIFQSMPREEQMKFLASTGGPNAGFDVSSMIPEQKYNEMVADVMHRDSWFPQEVQRQMTNQQNDPKGFIETQGPERAQLFATLRSLPEAQQKQIMDLLNQRFLSRASGPNGILPQAGALPAEPPQNTTKPPSYR
jgi:hypothetical protein